jgi:hypothetical protein
MVLVLYALFYVFLVLFIFFDSFKQEFNKLELSGKEERKLVNVEDPLTRDFPDPLYEEFEESSSESSDVNLNQINPSIPIRFFKLLLFVCCFSQVIEEVYDEFFKVISLLPYGSDFMISGGRKHLSQFICSILNKKEKEERDLWGLPPISLSVYCRNNQIIPYNSLAHLRPHK